MALTTVENLVLQLRLSAAEATAQNALLTVVLAAAENAISNYCNRTFEATDYREYFIEDTPELFVVNTPIIRVNRFTITSVTAMLIRNTSDDAVRAYVLATDAGFRIAIVGGNNETAEVAVDVSTYTTMALVETYLEGLSKGWDITIHTGYDDWPTSDIIRNVPIDCLNAYADILVPSSQVTNYLVDYETGEITRNIVRRNSHVIVEYRGGFETVPPAVSQIAVELAARHYYMVERDMSLKRERIEDYEWESVGLTIDKDLKERLNAWKVYELR